jgi:uncharacterized RDD family membrane protein YckC
MGYGKCEVRSAMSIPVPVPPLPITVEAPSFGGYSGLPGAIEGVSFWPRFAARVIDTIVHYLVSLIAGFLFGILLVIVATATGHNSALQIAKLRQVGLSSFVFALLGSVAYHTICEGIHGSTLGKLMLSMVVVQEDGSPCKVRSALLRSIAYFVDGMFFGLVGYLAMQKTPQQQRYGDEWAHTIVCKRDRVAARSEVRLNLSLLFFWPLLETP